MTNKDINFPPVDTTDMSKIFINLIEPQIKGFNDFGRRIIQAATTSIQLYPDSNFYTKEQQSIDQKFNEHIKAILNMPELKSAKEKAQKTVEQLFKIYPEASSNPIPYLRQFDKDLLAAIGSVSVTASRVEALMANLHDSFFDSEQESGIVLSAHEPARQLYKKLEDHAPCQECKEIAKECESAFKQRNEILHSHWNVGERDMSEEARKGIISPFTFVFESTYIIKRRPKNEIKKAKDTPREELKGRDIFTFQFIRIDKILEIAEKLSSIADRFEEEYDKHNKG